MLLGLGNADPVRIVIADDDHLFSLLARAQLGERSEFEVVGIAQNGWEAVGLANELEPDLVLMDVSMPVLDGVEASRIMRAAENPPAVVLMTGEDEESDACAYEAGAAAYLRKSAGLGAVVDVIFALSVTPMVC